MPKLKGGKKKQPEPLTPEEKFRKVFTVREPPEGERPVMTIKVSHCTSDQLSDMYTKYAAWREYAEDQHMDALADYMRKKDAYEYLHDQKYIMAQGESVTDKKAFVNADAEVYEKWRQVLDAEIYMKMLAGKLESYNNILSVLSRELTRRGLIPGGGA